MVTQLKPFKNKNGCSGSSFFKCEIILTGKMKKSILLIEKEENELDFFTEALEESKVSFLCRIAKNREQATSILKNMAPDIIFIDLNTAGNDVNEFLRHINCIHRAPVILYSTLPGKIINKAIPEEISGCFQLPGNVQTMAFMLQGILDTKRH